jgi:hypothetical protein
VIGRPDGDCRTLPRSGCTEQPRGLTLDKAVGKRCPGNKFSSYDHLVPSGHENAILPGVAPTLLDNLQNGLMAASSGGCGQEIPHRRDSMTVPPDYFAYVGTAHFYLKDDLFPLLLPGDQHLVGCIH